jgi:YVTN family beta-propeller protein
MDQGSNSVSVIRNGYLAGTFPVSGSPWAAAHSLLDTMWIASSDSGRGFFTKMSPYPGPPVQTVVVNNHQPAAVVTVPVDYQPEPLIFFVDVHSNSLFMLDPTTGAVTSISSINSGGAQALLFDGTNIWASNYAENTVSKVDPLGGALRGTFGVGNAPFGLAFDGSSIWVANNEDDTVTQLNANDGQTLQTITTGASPACIAFDGVNIWVTNMGDNTLTQIRASDGVVLRNFATGLSPLGVVFDGVNVWVANSGENTVSRFQP